MKQKVRSSGKKHQTQRDKEKEVMNCRTCGKQMKVCKRFVSLGFDENTGQEYFSAQIQCPKRKWGNSHSKLTVYSKDKEGENFYFTMNNTSEVLIAKRLIENVDSRKKKPKAK